MIDNKEIVEGNWIIASFMGATITDGIGYTGRNISFPTETNGLYVHKLTDLKYNSSWDWLMPVVEKIEDLERGMAYNVEMYNVWCVVTIGTQYAMTCDVEFTEIKYRTESKIESTWRCIVDFIKWYNYINSNKDK